MINYTQIQRLASKEGIPEEAIEKDYLIELILFYIAKDRYLNKLLVFRGGTALKKVYFPGYRFSEDLDFLVEDEGSIRECQEKLDQILIKISSEYPFQLNKRLEQNKDRLGFFILYDIIPEIRTTKELKVDILKDDFIPAFREKEILFCYEDFKEKRLSLKTYILESVASDKINRILGVDNEPRDLYDLLYLLKSNVDIGKVKEELKKRHGYEAYLPNLLGEISKEAYRKNWEFRLKHQIVNLPCYETVIDELRKLIKMHLL